MADSYIHQDEAEIIGSATSSMRAIQIPCCLCGTMIHPNAANQCGSCLAQQFDLKTILQRGPGGSDLIIHQCRQCRRYERSENVKQFADYQLESPELLALCLKRIPALQPGSHKQSGASQIDGMMQNRNAVESIHLADAMWVWTEPNSMRLKIRLTVRANVIESPRTVTVQQRVLVEFRVAFKQCPDCNREYTNRTWQAIVQVRQKRATSDAPRKGLIMLEMALAKNAHIRRHIIRMQTTRNGFDFYFMSLPHAQMLSSFVARIVPMKIKTSKKLVSEDVKNNTANVKHTVTCDLVPLCRDDLVIADKAATKGGGGAGRLSGRLCLVTKVSSNVHFVDASPMRGGDVTDCFADLPPEKYWKAGAEKSYRVLLTSRALVRFIVLDVELCSGGNNQYHHQSSEEDRDLYAGPKSGVEKYALADVEVARESDFGHNDETFQCVTHLGNLLSVGDVVLGYDMVSSVLSSEAEWSVENAFNSSFVMPDIILVKKLTGSGGGGGETMDGGDTAENGDEKKPSRSKKSGTSKKRERRRMRGEKKAKELEETAARMGFFRGEKKGRELEEAAARMGFFDDADRMGEGAEEDDDGLMDEERAAFERELQNDPELAKELNEAEQELATRASEMKDESISEEEEKINDSEEAGIDEEGGSNLSEKST
mmetsp:Transcript_38507/g.57723  ORF Transcript_38507/g.57723 Transcript_38507/m.57723 type:complete len:656 (-) Transcript_38507:293-2260(-)